jgi:uncharacterized protein YcfJ
MKKLLSLVALATFLQAETIQFTEYVSVRSSTPQYETVSESVPYQECHQEQVPVQQVSQRRYHDNVAGSILGGAIGGVLGHQVGRGRGKDAATIGGAILGTIVGGNTIGAHQRDYQPAYQPVSYQTRQNCTTRYRQSRAHRELRGYENVAYYKGKRIVKYSNQRLSSIPVTVTIDY